MLIGRVPGKTSTQVTELVNKIIRFETSSRTSAKKVLLVADNEVGFENLSEKLTDFLPSNFSADKVYLRNSYKTVTQDIVSSINNGVMVTNYVGHGSIDWGIKQTKIIDGYQGSELNQFGSANLCHYVNLCQWLFCRS